MVSLRQQWKPAFIIWLLAQSTQIQCSPPQRRSTEDLAGSPPLGTPGNIGSITDTSRPAAPATPPGGQPSAAHNGSVGAATSSATNASDVQVKSANATLVAAPSNASAGHDSTGTPGSQNSTAHISSVNGTTPLTVSASDAHGHSVSATLPANSSASSAAHDPATNKDPSGGAAKATSNSTTSQAAVSSSTGAAGANQTALGKPNVTSTMPPIEVGLIEFNTTKSQDFYVPGKKLPFVQWNIGPSYAGLLPSKFSPNETSVQNNTTTSAGASNNTLAVPQNATISSNSPAPVAAGSSPKAATNKNSVFFWFFPATSPAGVKKLTIWTSGGPGCSAMVGAVAENGPIMWRNGQAAPSPNTYSWTNQSSILYVEYPSGYSTDKSNSVEALGAAYLGFLKNWLQVFPEMSSRKLYFAGEGYAGLTIPHIVDYLLTQQTKLPMKPKGILLFNPILTFDAVQMQVPAYPYVKSNEQVFRLNDTTIKQLKALHKSCGYQKYLDTYLTFPPVNYTFPPPQASLYDVDGHKNSTCDVWKIANKAAKIVNPDFNPYQILDSAPRSSIFGTPTGVLQKWPGMTGDVLYFNRTDVKKLLHVPSASNWSTCTDPHAIIPQEEDLPPTASSTEALGRVISKTSRVVIAHGLLDFRVMANGTLLAIQNTTWAGQQGFQAPINLSYVVGEQGTVGHYNSERNLTYVELLGSGETVAEAEPRAALQLFQFLLGNTISPSNSTEARNQTSAVNGTAPGSGATANQTATASNSSGSASGTSQAASSAGTANSNSSASAAGAQSGPQQAANATDSSKSHEGSAPVNSTASPRASTTNSSSSAH